MPHVCIPFILLCEDLHLIGVFCNEFFGINSVKECYFDGIDKGILLLFWRYMMLNNIDIYCKE